MIPLLFAAALTLSPSPTDAAAPSSILKDLPQHPPNVSIQSFVLRGLPNATGSFVRPNGLPMVCDRSTTKTLGPDGLPLKKLGDLPPALEEHAVLRIMNGCPILEVVYGGQIYYFEGPVGGMEYDLRGRTARRNF